MNVKTDESGNPDFSDLFKKEFAVILLRGKNTFGKLIYSYVKVSIPNLNKLQDSLRNGINFNASDFGEVVAAGTGEPTAEVKAEIAAKYPMAEQKKEATPAGSPTAQPPAMPKKAWDEY
jgi:hypothetical protein